MAGCEYQIEGSDKIYSESEFKKLLSEGYLDKVMMDKGIKIKGIKADEALASSFQIPSAIQPQAPTEVKSDYQIAQDATNEVSKENPDASVLLTPKGEDLSLTAVYVAKENRGKGIGTKVLESVKKQADKLGKKVVLDATAELDEETDLGRLENFYQNNGFTKVGENKFEYNPTAEVKTEEKFYTGRGKKYEDLKTTKGEFIFFSKDPKIAEWYGGGDENNVSDAKLDTSNFLDLTTPESKSNFVKENFTDKDIQDLYKKEISFEKSRDVFGQLTEESLIKKYRERAEENRFSGDGKEQQFLLKKIKEQGYSGVKLLDTHFGKYDISYVVLDKSVINQSVEQSTPTQEVKSSTVQPTKPVTKTEEKVTEPTAEVKPDVVKSKKSPTFEDDGEHIVTVNGEEVGRMFYDKSQKTWGNAQFDKSSAPSNSYKWVYGDVLGDSKQEAIDELVKRHKESIATKQQEEVKKEEPKEKATPKKGDVINRLLDGLKNLSGKTIQKNPLAKNEYIYGDNVSLSFDTFNAKNENEVKLEGIVAFEKGKGQGQSAMNDINKVADEQGITLTLDAKPFGNDPNSLNKKQLIDFYKKNGFNVDPEYLQNLEFESEQEAIDYAIENESEALPMVREPKPTETKQPTREAVAAKNMADILRKAKIKMEGGTAMASFLPGFEDVWNGSIEAVSKAIELGGITAGNFRQSIEAGMKALKQTDAYKAITDPKERAKISARYKKILTSAYSERYDIDTDKLREAEFNDFNQKLEDNKGKTLSAKEFNALKSEAKKFVNDNLPTDSYRKSEVQSYVRNNFDKAKTVEDIQKNLDKVNSIMTTKEAKIQKETEKQAAKDRTSLIKNIESKIAANSKKVVSKNRRTGAKKGKITIESQQQINQIIQDLKDQGLFKNLDMLSDTELNDLNNTIDNILETGRVEQKQLEAVNDAKKRADKAIIFQALAGDSDDVLNGKEQVQERFKKANGYVIVDKQLMSSSDFKSYINKNPDTDLTDVPFYYKSESIDKVKQRLEKDSGILKAAKDGTLFNIVDLETHIKNLGAKSPELKKWLEDNIGNPIREAKRKEVESLWRETKQYKKDINKIFGTYSVKTKEFYRNKWRTKTVNIPKVYDTLVAPSDITPKNSDESLLAGEVVTLYMIVYNTNPEIKDKYKLDPKEAEKDMKTLMRENYVDPQKIYDFMHKPENKSLLDFAHFLSKKYNEDARAMFGPTIEQFHQIALGNTYYHPKIRSSSTLEPESIMNLEQDKSLSITSPNMRHRTDNASAPFKIISAHELYLNYLKSMTHAKEYIPVVKAAQTLLTDVNKPYIMEKLGSVSDYNDMVKALSIAITDKSPFESGPMSALTNWTALTMLWFRIKSIPQQASSLVHYYTSGIKDGVMPWDILRAVPTTKEEREFSAKFYSDNPYLWTRLSGGNITPEMQKLKEQTDSLSNSLIKGTLSLARFTGLIGIKFGDFAAAATPGGGVSFALAQFKKKFKETGDYQSSRDFAIQRWMEETERTGQVSLAREIMSTQSFNTLVRLFIPFSSAQQGMGKKAYKAYLDIKDSENLTNKEYAQAIADLIYFPLLAPLPFLLTGNAGAALFRMFFDDEEDETLEDAQKKRIYHDLIFDAAQSNATALGLPGLLLNVTMNIARDRAGFNQSPSYQRLTDIGTELVSLLSSNKKWEDLSVSERKQFTKDYISENGSLKGKNIKDIYDDSIVSEKQINLLLKSIGAKNIKDLIESIKKLSKDKDFWAFFLDLETKDDKINKKLDPYFNQAVKNNKKDELYEFLSRLQRYFEDEDYKIEEYIPKEGIKTKSKRTSKFSSPKIQKPKISRPKMPKF